MERPSATYFGSTDFVRPCFPKIRSGDFKLLEYYENGTVQLFDLANDIGERNDLAEERPEVVAKLKKQFEDWRDEVDAKMPYPKTATSKPAPGARVVAPRGKGK